MLQQPSLGIRLTPNRSCQLCDGPVDARAPSRPAFPCNVGTAAYPPDHLKEDFAMRNARGYVRVSTDEQAERGLGLEAQRQRIRAYCEMKGLRLTTMFEDPGLSGGKPLGSRSAGGRLLAEARKTKPVVVVAKLDRLFRSVADAAQTITSFDRYGIELVAISEGFDMTNPYGRAMAQMASVFAELERAMIRERTRAAMIVKRGRNDRISGHAPFGWDFGRGGKLLANAKEQKI